jgi:AraC-like DNA-binding protein
VLSSRAISTRSRKPSAVGSKTFSSLVGAAGDTATVHAIAERWGFWHTGEFASDYRRLFGQLPSETLHGLPGWAQGPVLYSSPTEPGTSLHPITQTRPQDGEHCEGGQQTHEEDRDG